MQNNERQVREITDRLEAGLRELFDSEKYKEYLNVMAKFYNYSLNNTLLIAMQRPDASLIAGYNSWRKDFGRYVKKGEKGIKIFAPAPYKTFEKRVKIDPETRKPVLDENGEPVTEVTEVVRNSFRVVNVFDVSQTEGRELPDISVNELTGSVENYEIFVDSLMLLSPVPIDFDDIYSGAKGYFSHVEERIVIQEGMSEVQTVKTAIHEIAHAKLHAVNSGKDRHTKEVEAESVAYTVCQHFGIETSDYSFGYIAGWSADKDATELRNSLETIRSTAAEMIGNIEDLLREHLPPVFDRETEILSDTLASLGMNDIELTFDTDGLVATDGKNTWHGAELYKHIIVRSGKRNLTEDFRELAEHNGVIVSRKTREKSMER